MVRRPRLVFGLLLWTIVLAASPQSYAAPPPHAGEGGPVQVEECRVIDAPGSYVLVGNLPGTEGLLPSGNCLEISADYVTVDLGGFVITGDGAGAGVAYVGLLPAQLGYGITVRNGTVVGFFDGVRLQPGRGHTVEGVRAIANANWGISVVARNCNLTGNTAVNNGATGILGGDSCKVSDNVATANGFGPLGALIGDGISAGIAGTVTGNTVKDNFRFGLDVASFSTVSGNTATDNGDLGIRVREHSNVSGNTASRNDLNEVRCGDDIVVFCPSLIMSNKALGAVVAFGNPGVANCASPANHNLPAPVFLASGAPCPVP